MPIIRLSTRIKAPVERVFDLKRSIDLHLETAQSSNEKVVSGKKTGLLEIGEEVTWQGLHLGFNQTLRVRLVELEHPHHFVDEMVEGAFAHLKHSHHFEEVEGVTLMTEEFDYKSKGGPIGWLVENSFLTAYFRRFLAERNKTLKKVAESEDWQRYLPAK